MISYVALPKKEKLTIYKQIASHFKYDNKDMEDKDFIQIFLLEEKDLKNENFVNNDNSLNLNNSLVKKLVKKHDNIKKII